MDQRTMNMWNYTNGGILMFSYDELNENSVVFDIGSYPGEYTEKIYDKYKCNVYMFEPVTSFYNELVEKYKDNPKIKVFKMGLSNSTRECEINILDAASSTKTSINGSKGKETILLKDIVEFINEEKIKFIHLMKINIEGDEYDVLPRLIESKIVSNVGNVLVQFHDFIPNAINMRADISNKLSATHIRTWNMDFIWENWKIIYNPETNKMSLPNFESNLLKFIKEPPR